MSCRCGTSLAVRLLFAVVEEERGPAVRGIGGAGALALLEELHSTLLRAGNEEPADRRHVAMLTVAQAAERLQQCRKTIQRRCHDGTIEGARKVGRRWLIPEASLAKLGTSPRLLAVAETAAPRARISRSAASAGSASEAFAALTGNSNGRGHGKVVAHSKKSAPRDAPTSGGLGTGRKEASTMNQATVSALADARTHAIGRRGGR